MDQNNTFDLDVGLVDSRNTTFRIITVFNNITSDQNGASLNVSYYLSQVYDTFKVFLVKNNTQPIVSFERDFI